jgi:uncharacterized protein (TIGR02145 family)
MDKRQFCDKRDGKKYVYVTIGEGKTAQTWMAENLNYAVAGSKCGNGSSLSDANTTTCDTYGRLYNWETAISACPTDWHLPSLYDWNVLSEFVGGSSTEGKHLKATSGWNSNGNGLDTYGFAALPGGGGKAGGSFYDIGDSGYWWSSSESGSDGAYLRAVGYSGEGAIWDGIDKYYLFSVRCLQD